MAVELSDSDRIETLLSQSRSFYVIDSTGILQHFENFLPEPQESDLYAGLFAEEPYRTTKARNRSRYCY